MFSLLFSKLKLKHWLGFLCLLTTLVWLAVFSFPTQKLQVIFCDVGQGDAILIQKGENQILIDGGPGKQVLDCLANNLPFWDRTLEIVALTHSQSDHLEGINYVMERYSVKHFLIGVVGNETAGFKKLAERIRSDKNLKVINPFLGENIKMAGLELQTLWPERNWVLAHLRPETAQDYTFGSQVVLGAATSQDLNDFSLVFLLKYGPIEVLFPGDADAGIQDEILLNNNTLNKIDILKVPHHGARTGLEDNFLQMIMPKEAIISVGRNSYGHPDAGLIKRLTDLGIKVRRTDLEGEITYEF